MPFGQLVVGSPGAGKSTYCDGSKFNMQSTHPWNRQTN
jgi:adenylate kinase family enzyme